MWLLHGKKAILDIWNNIDIRNTFSDIINYNFCLVPIELLISGIRIFTSNNVVIDIKNDISTSKKKNSWYQQFILNGSLW